MPQKQTRISQKLRRRKKSFRYSVHRTPRVAEDREESARVRDVMAMAKREKTDVIIVRMVEIETISHRMADVKK